MKLYKVNQPNVYKPMSRLHGVVGEILSTWHNSRECICLFVYKESNGVRKSTNVPRRLLEKVKGEVL